MALRFDGRGSSAVRLIPDDGNNLPNVVTSIHPNVTGMINVIFMQDSTRVSLNVTSGVTYNYSIKKLYQTGTTANDIIGMV